MTEIFIAQRAPSQGQAETGRLSRNLLIIKYSISPYIFHRFSYIINITIYVMMNLLSAFSLRIFPLSYGTPLHTTQTLPTPTGGCFC